MSQGRFWVRKWHRLCPSLSFSFKHQPILHIQCSSPVVSYRSSLHDANHVESTARSPANCRQCRSNHNVILGRWRLCTNCAPTAHRGFNGFIIWLLKCLGKTEKQPCLALHIDMHKQTNRQTDANHLCKDKMQKQGNTPHNKCHMYESSQLDGQNNWVNMFHFSLLSFIRPIII